MCELMSSEVCTSSTDLPNPYFQVREYVVGVLGIVVDRRGKWGLSPPHISSRVYMDTSFPNRFLIRRSIRSIYLFISCNPNVLYILFTKVVSVHSYVSRYEIRLHSL